MRGKRKIPIGLANLQPGERRIIEVEGKSIGLFNVNGSYFAMHNRCPHMGGNLCEGPITGTTLFTDEIAFVYGRKNELVRCGWHGWEFDIQTGQCLVDAKLRARTYLVTRDGDELTLHI